MGCFCSPSRLCLRGATAGFAIAAIAVAIAIAAVFFFRAINDPPDPRVPLGDPRDPGDMF